MDHDPKLAAVEGGPAETQWARGGLAGRKEREPPSLEIHSGARGTIPESLPLPSVFGFALHVDADVVDAGWTGATALDDGGAYFASRRARLGDPGRS
jgi:hypothetical protein